MIETSARLLRLLTLLGARSSWSGSDLAERLRVTERTVRRDVEKLRALGYPVNSSTGLAGGYQLGSGAALPPLMLDDDEALAVVVGLRMAAALAVSGIEDAAIRALATLEQVLPTRLRRQVKELYDAVSPLYHVEASVPGHVLAALAAACRRHETVRFRYMDGTGAASERLIEPHGLVHTGARWYLVAWDRDREDWRTFRVDRVDGTPKGGGDRFVTRTVPGGDLAQFVSRSLAYSPYAIQARIVLHAPLDAMKPRVPPVVGQLSSIDDGSCLLLTGAQSPRALAIHLALLDVQFEVIEPQELIDHLDALAQRLAAAHRASQ